MIKAIIFDCFGVLVTEWLAVLADGYAIETRTKLWDIVHASNSGFLDASEATKQMAETLDLTVEEFLAYRTQNESKNELLLKYIKTLRNKNLKIAVLSNVSAGGIARRFTETERSELFDVVVESGSIGFAKPDANAYMYTCELLDLEPYECIMIDDKEDFCVGAEAVGMSSLVYADFESFRTKLDTLLADSDS